MPRPRKTGIRKTPPNPALAQKCALCKDFTHAGSTMNYIRSNCRDCGHVEQKPREVTFTHDPSTCRHEVVDRRGSSRSVSRTFCKQCDTFIDEVPGKFHAQRSSKVLDATSHALDVINAMTNKEAVTDYSPEAVEAILGEFNDRVLQAIQDEDRVDDIILHDHLREAFAKTMEDPNSPWSDVTAAGTSPTPVAMMVYDEHGVPVFDTTGMPYSKATRLRHMARGVVWPPYPQGTEVDPTARANLMIANWGAFANRLLRNYTKNYMFKFWRIEKRRRAVVMRERTWLEGLSSVSIPNMDLSGQPTSMNVLVILRMSQLLQWLLQQVMFQLLYLDCLHSQLSGLIELWMSSMHQARVSGLFQPQQL